MAIIDLDLDTIREGLADGSILLIDVREAHEFAMGHIPESLSMPLSTFDPEGIPEAEGRRIVFSCAAGVRSRHALMMAQAAGLPLAEHYAGGFKDWVMAGEEIARGD
ncbi:MAG: sulfurtransferase [Methylobacterium sp.]|nr:sulfurtransferase [Methylobacterium sp.]MCA3606226.1 sulfurtransferase [Methylobacterium sp.]MCA3609895.1 sulfurtransferase [Methylobacterium sp.]MCA3616497.1 sulfurtransferase [Methylobacterium sp.]MCA3620892.1 sulfurtransferase [Methylobacterium sp.]